MFGNIDHIKVTPQLFTNDEDMYYITVDLHFSETTLKKLKLLYGITQNIICLDFHSRWHATINKTNNSIPNEFKINDDYYLSAHMYKLYVDDILDLNDFNSSYDNIDDIINVMDTPESTNQLLDSIVQFHIEQTDGIVSFINKFKNNR